MMMLLTASIISEIKSLSTTCDFYYYLYGDTTVGDFEFLNMDYYQEKLAYSGKGDLSASLAGKILIGLYDTNACSQTFQKTLDAGS